MASTHQSGALRVDCTQCHFERVVDGEEVRPAEVVIDHGRETGHKLSVDRDAA